MNKACKGLVYTVDAIEKDAVDPEGLEISKLGDFGDLAAYTAYMEKAGANPADPVWEDLTAICRGWYDA